MIEDSMNMQAMDNKETHLPLHHCHVHKLTLFINRSFIFLQSIPISLLICYRLFNLTHKTNARIPFLPHFLIFLSELTLSFIWLLHQAFQWRPVSRTTFPERLPENEKLPAIDVFICTADPHKEPAEGVMNTVLSAMALDYPAEKINVYVSDDGGSNVTLKAMEEAWRFAKVWLPFCRKYGVLSRSPQVYFDENGDDNEGTAIVSAEFIVEKDTLKQEYQVYTARLRSMRVSESNIVANGDHPPLVQVIGNKYLNENSEDEDMPLLVYVSREKRPSHPHHFKAGALNTLLRVSGLISNSPYILGLDCDMFCNDPSSARQAMCFHLDPTLSPSLAFVQFPQRFSNISKHDIYESELRSTFKTLWNGMDGIKGPCLSGTCYYLKREAIYGINPIKEGIDLMELRKSFGSSNEFVQSLHGKYKLNVTHEKDFTNALLKDTHLVASCVYEDNTKWGKEVGFRYLSVVEDYFTSFNIHCKGWISVYLDPPRAAFLGAGVTSLNDLLVQGTRWSAGLIEVGLSKFSPIIYGSFRMSIIQSMCYGWMAFFPCYFLPFWILATIPQLCLLYGIPIFPEVKSPFFMVFLFIFLSSHFQHIREILSTGAPFPLRIWKNEQRIWMIKAVTSQFYGSLHAIMEKIGKSEATFLPTNKAINDQQEKLYQMGTFNFETSPMLLIPLCSLVILNLVAFVGGAANVISEHSFNEMFIQIFISLFAVIMGFPIIEGMILRKDKGRIAPSLTLVSAAITSTILCLGYMILLF